MQPRGRARTRSQKPALVRSTVVQATRAALRAGRPDERGMLHASGDGVVPVAVSRVQVTRAVALVDLILRTAERRGMAVAVVTEPGQPTRIDAGQGRFSSGAGDGIRRARFADAPPDSVVVRS
jgi:hypothetical protein